MANILKPKVKSRLQEKYKELNEAGSLLSSEDLKRYYRLFREKFGPEALESLSGKELLETIHNSSNRESLVYWLEFKNDDDFPAKFGSIAGGSALKFGLYRRAESGEWMTGVPRNQKILSVDEAIVIANKHKNQIIEGSRVLSQFKNKSGEAEYVKLQQELSMSSPDIYDLAWGHKYFSLLYPDILDDYHNLNWQKHHLIKLQIEPPEDFGR